MDTLWLNSITCFLMYRKKELLDHWPMSMVHWAFTQVHGHCGRFDLVYADFFLGDSQACFANGAHGIAEGVDQLPGCDMFNGAVGRVGRDIGVG